MLAGSCNLGAEGLHDPSKQRGSPVRRELSASIPPQSPKQPKSNTLSIPNFMMRSLGGLRARQKLR